MIVLMQRQPRPDAPYWPWRRRLAALDALSWPLAVALLLRQIPNAQAQLFAVNVVIGLWAFFRLYGAVFNNHRYWFTTWKAARLLGLLLLIQLVVKLAMLAS